MLAGERARVREMGESKRKAGDGGSLSDSLFSSDLLKSIKNISTDNQPSI